MGELKETYYCFKCRRKTKYTIIKKMLNSTYKGITVLFNGKEVRCNVCGGLISIREITNENIKRGHKKYKEILEKLGQK